MKIASIIASILLIFGVTTPSEARLSTIFEPKEKDKDRYKALCSDGGIFDGCSVFVENNKLNSISIHGVSEIASVIAVLVPASIPEAAPKALIS